MNNATLSEQYAEIAERWVDADAAANLLEDCKSAFLSQRMLACGDMAVNKAEMSVKGSRDWEDYIRKTVAARKQANLCKVQMETIKMRFQEWISEDANRRVEARL